MSELDPKLTFDSFVIGPANRLASAAARRAVGSPGTSYNPLFLYSEPGLGKTHILTAIAHESEASDQGLRVEYMQLEEYLERLEAGRPVGVGDGLNDDDRTLDILLLDDVQFLTGQPDAQDLVLKTLDRLSAAGGQIVLASDRPPADIDGLDARLLSRFSGGLIVDLGPPDVDTRVAIIRKKAEERGQALAGGVAEAVARQPLKNVRELGGVLNKIFAIQELEGRDVTIDEVGVLMEERERTAVGGDSDEFGAFLSDLASSVEEAVAEREPPWAKTIRDTIESAERQGFSSARLAALQGGVEPEGWEEIVERFKVDIQRLHEIDNELERLGNPWPEAAQGVLDDPDRLEEAEALISSVRERQRAFPRLGDGPQLHDLDGFEGIALKAAAQLVGDERPEYNPLYVWSADADLARTLLGAVGRTHREVHPTLRMAVTSVESFSDDFIRARGEGVAGAWRERWWTLDLLLVHGIHQLSQAELAQDEFFHLFEALKRRGARMMIAGDRPPTSFDSIDERLKSRLEGGLVLEVSGGMTAEIEVLDVEEVTRGEGAFVPALESASNPQRSQPIGGPAEIAGTRPPEKGGAWFPGPENVVIHWPKLDDLLFEDLD